PPHYNFEAIPLVGGRHPLWDEEPLVYARSGADESTKALGREGALHKETPIMSGLDTRPETTMTIPHETYVPFFVALGIAVFFLGLLISAVVVGILGVVLGVVALLMWTWRTDVDLR